MPTRKRAVKSKAGKRAKTKVSIGRAASRATSGDGGPVPPYGPPIREAIARGDVNEMRRLAARTRRWLRDVKAALARLEKAIDEIS